jgi:hypothetical protein
MLVLLKNKRQLTNAMGILLNTTMLNGREIVVDHMLNILYVDTPGANTSCDENRSIAGAEGSHGVLALRLGTITVNRGHWQTNIVQIIIEIVDFVTTVGENDGSHAGHLFKSTNKIIALLLTINLHYDLLDIGRGAACTSDTESNVAGRKILTGKVTSRLGKGGGEETKLDVALILF